MKALKHIKALQSEFPSSALVLALKVLVYAIIGGEVGVSSVLSKTEAKVFSDISAFPDVLTTFEAVWLHLGHLDKATYIYEFARVEDCNSFGLMRRLFNCYSHKSLFVKQLKVSLKMYKLVREDKFLFWAVFCIHLQVLSLLIKKHGMDNLLDEPESFLVYMSITEQQEIYDPVREILCKLGSTLLVVKADKQHLLLLLI